MRWVACRAASGDAPPSPRFGHTATACAGGRYVVVFGGLDRASASATKGALNDVVVLDVAQDAWFRPRAANVDAPPPRAFHCACATGDGRCVVVTCGRDGRAQHGDAWRLDCETWTWTRLTRAETTPRDFASVAAVMGEDSIVMFGGFDGKGWIGEAETLTRASESDASWTPTEAKPARLEAIEAVTSHIAGGSGRATPEPRSGSAMVAHGPNLLIYGGQGANGSAFNDTWCLRRESDGGWRWVRLVLRGSPPTSRAGHGMSMISAGGIAAPNVVVTGGVGDDGWLVKERTYFDDAYFLDGDNAKWQKLTFSGEGNGPSSRAYHTLTQVSLHKCLCFGGFNGANACNDAWWLVADDMEYADITAEARASPRALVDVLRANIDENRCHAKIDVFDGNDAAFRHHIASCDADDVRLGDVPKLMCEYVAATANLGLPDEHRREDGQGRFRHCDPQTMRLRDVSDALTELQGAYVANA
tara:strand:- start:2532 stop:3953 length:1422 start_codon:yes stop_codon:yes gene_type:complete